jgi:signal transduction histidine kinase
LAIELEEEIDKGNYADAKAIAKDIRDNEEKINHHGKRADAIVKGMLAHSKSDTGKKELTNLNALAEEYLRLAFGGMLAKDKNFSANYRFEPDPNLPKIEVIPQDIGRVLLNLFNNALYAVQERSKNAEPGYTPEVVVSTGIEDNGVKLAVKDNGGGIPESIKGKIFQPFFTTKPTGQGTGLGLSLSYDIVTKGHGGNLQFSSEPWKGAQFSIFLPLKG